MIAIVFHEWDIDTHRVDVFNRRSTRVLQLVEHEFYSIPVPARGREGDQLPRE